jgi:carboxyl-terminal processing protease
MKRHFVFGLTAALLAMNLLFGAWTYHVDSKRGQARMDSMNENMDLFADVLQKVRVEYVDATNLNYHSLVYSALQGMVGKLDPHSEFLDAGDYRQLQDDTEGKFGGLGLDVEMRDGYVTVLAPMDGGPGFRAGILSGDRIIRIDGKDIGRMLLTDAVRQLRGEPGTLVTVTIQRPHTGLVRDFTLKRAIIQIAMIKDINGRSEFPLVADNIGYVRITEFGEKTSDELEGALQKLGERGMKALILDLRGNPGGLLDEAVEVCQKFLPRGQLVVSTEGYNPLKNSIRRADGRGDELKGMPIVILANYSSASAAEIVAGCLQDLHRAIVLGEQTFGKGSVQSIFPIDDGAALKLTTARYYTPSHKVIHGRGITPDILVPLGNEEEAALLLKRELGGFESLDATNRMRIEKIQDTQLARAVDLLKGILIYSQLENQPAKAEAK